MAGHIARKREGGSPSIYFVDIIRKTSKYDGKEGLTKEDCDDRDN